VLEAVTEDPRVKGQLFQRLDEALPDARFLASNTSSIPIAELAAWTQRPERVSGCTSSHRCR
jgi:3-hydroxybutyryl-CoA dehydrogenase